MVSNTNNSIQDQSFVCTQLNGYTVLFDPLMRLSGTTTQDQSETGNSNEGIFHIPQSSRTEASPSDAVYCHTWDNHLCAVGLFEQPQPTGLFLVGKGGKD